MNERCRYCGLVHDLDKMCNAYVKYLSDSEAALSGSMEVRAGWSE